MKSNTANLALTVAFLIIAGLGCQSVTEGKPAAEKAITRFHQMLGEEKYVEIYNESSSEMKGLATQEDLTKLLTAVNTKLGKVKSTSTHSWRVNYGLSATVTLVQETQFEKGKGSEQFIFTLHGSEAKLTGYHINSMDMMIQ